MCRRPLTSGHEEVRHCTEQRRRLRVTVCRLDATGRYQLRLSRLRDKVDIARAAIQVTDVYDELRRIAIGECSVVVGEGTNDANGPAVRRDLGEFLAWIVTRLRREVRSASSRSVSACAAGLLRPG